jgi:hypothetical protein
MNQQARNSQPETGKEEGCCEHPDLHRPIRCQGHVRRQLSQIINSPAPGCTLSIAQAMTTNWAMKHTVARPSEAKPEATSRRANGDLAGGLGDSSTFGGHPLMMTTLLLAQESLVRPLSAC